MRLSRKFKTNQSCHLVSRIVDCADSFPVRGLTPLAKAGCVAPENPAGIHSPRLS